MAPFRSLVAVLVTVVTLFGGAFRLQSTLRAQVALQNANSDAQEVALDARPNVAQGRATKSSPPEPRDGLDPALVALPAVRVASFDVLALAAPESVVDRPHRRVRRHVENMVFLI